MKTSSLSRIDEIPAEFTEVISGITDPPYHHQIPPYGKLGQPYVITKHELVYPVVDSAAARYGQTNRYNYQNVRFRPNWSYLQKERLTEQLRRCFPFVYVITHCICVILNSLIQIGLQIALMATNGALWWVGAGIWAGVYFIIMALLTLLLAKTRNYWLFIITYIMHIIGFLMAIGAYLIVNIIGISEYTDLCSYFPNCFNQSVKVLSYLLFWFGVILIIFILAYLILMPFYIMDIPNEYRLYKQAKRENTNIYESSTVSAREVKVPDLVKHSAMYMQTDVDSDKHGNSYYYSPINNIGGYKNLGYQSYDRA